MANIDIRKGLEPVDHQINTGFCGKQRPYYVPATYATALFVGDPVIKMGTSNTAIVDKHAIGSLPEVNLATAGDGNFITGVITGFKLPQNGAAPFAAPYRLASTEMIVMVNDDPYTIFEIQADTPVAIASTDTCSNANLIYTHGGDIVSGLSGTELDTSSMTTTATYQLNILGTVDRPDNSVGVNAKLLVRINKHTEAPLTAGI